MAWSQDRLMAGWPGNRTSVDGAGPRIHRTVWIEDCLVCVPAAVMVYQRLLHTIGALHGLRGTHGQPDACRVYGQRSLLGLY
eukprot:365072-Chlamydomonas_euryale.AAC.16